MDKGPEHILLTETINSGLFSRKKQDHLFLTELPLPSGLPDLVIVSMNNKKACTLFTKERRSLTDKEIRLFHLINYLKHPTLYELTQYTGKSEKAVLRLVDNLAKCNMVSIVKDNIKAMAVKDNFAASKIIAIEAKISAWRKAIYQAMSNRWFASETYILIPPKRNIDLICYTSRLYGVGVIVKDVRKSNKPCIVEKSSTAKIPASYGSWLVHEKALALINR